MWYSPSVNSQLSLSSLPTSTQDVQEGGNLLSGTSASRNSNYLLCGWLPNLGMKLTDVNMSLKDPQWCRMENREKGVSFRTISASLGAAVVSILQNICMTVSNFSLFLSFGLSCPWSRSLMTSSYSWKNIDDKSRMPTSAYEMSSSSKSQKASFQWKKCWFENKGEKEEMCCQGLVLCRIPVDLHRRQSWVGFFSVIRVVIPLMKVQIYQHETWLENGQFYEFPNWKKCRKKITRIPHLFGGR